MRLSPIKIQLKECKKNEMSDVCPKDIEKTACTSCGNFCQNTTEIFVQNDNSKFKTYVFSNMRV